MPLAEYWAKELTLGGAASILSQLARVQDEQE
jgi:hypothetical protein